jgi:hypothetical protein
MTDYWVVNGEMMGVYFFMFISYFFVCLQVMGTMGFFFLQHLFCCCVCVGCIFCGVEWFALRLSWRKVKELKMKIRKELSSEH